MKVRILIVIMFVSTSLLAQKKVGVFKTIYYGNNGSVFKENTDTIDMKNEKQDIYFFSNHLYIYNLIPGKQANVKHKSDTVVEYSAPYDKKNILTNPAYAYIYDSTGLLMEFRYYSCEMCSQLPFTYFFKYDENGRVKQMDQAAVPVNDYFLFYYDKEGNVKRIEKYVNDKINQSVFRVGFR